MGSYFSSLLKRLFDYPIKEKPICFVRQEDYTSTGEPLDKEDEEKEAMTQYDNLCHTFFTRLLAERRQSKLLREHNYQFAVQKQIESYPGWNEMTLTNLQGIFHLFDTNQSGLINYESFCSLMESFGDDSTQEHRKADFEKADKDLDGWVDYNEFLALLYYYDPPDDNGNLTGLAKRCKAMADDINFVSKLSVGEQIEYGLF